MPPRSTEPSGRRNGLRNIAETTLNAIKHGSFTLDDILHDLNIPTQLTRRGTRYYAPDSLLSTWSSALPTSQSTSTEISILEISTLDGARFLANSRPSTRSSKDRIGVLNFASAKNPGGGFQNGAQAQEESIARSSTLYSSLMTDTAQRFYTLHKRDPKGGYYSHAMIYSPSILLFRDDTGGWTEPLEVDVLTSPAVNAGVVRNSLHGRVGGKAEERRIEAAMRERMARILFLFEQQGAKDVVLGSFGTGVFRNSIEMVARIWAELLVVDGARYKASFDHVVFAILGRKTFDTFKDSFEGSKLGEKDAEV